MIGKIWRSGAVLSSALLLANTAPDAFDRVVASLVSGSMAERRGSADTMLAAATALIREGAKPLDNSPDLVVRWQSRGRSAGGKSRAAEAVYRDRALGAGYRMIALPAGATMRFDQTFLAGQKARVAIVPLTKGEFGLSVHDDEGYSVCIRPTNTSQCDWVPNWTTRYRILLSNLGKIKSHYYIVMQ